MKSYCLFCKQQDLRDRLWCRRSMCNGVDKIPIFDPGEWLGEVELLQPITILPHATIYKARRARKKVWIKIAHPGLEEQIKREARFLNQLSATEKRQKLLPRLLPAYSNSRVDEYPYGKGILHGLPLTFSIFKDQNGVSLDSWLTRNRQPWIEHVGMIGLQLFEALTFLHQNGRLHLILEPRSILIRNDRDDMPRLTLLDLGLIADMTKNELPPLPIKGNIHFLAPEVQQGTTHAGERSDLFSVGICLQEMLDGQAKTIESSMNQNAVREDLDEALISWVQKLHAKVVNERPPNSDEAINQMARFFPPVRREKPELGFDWGLISIVSGSLLIISFLIFLANITF